MTLYITRISGITIMIYGPAILFQKHLLQSNDFASNECTLRHCCHGNRGSTSRLNGIWLNAFLKHGLKTDLIQMRLGNYMCICMQADRGIILHLRIVMCNFKGL